LLAGPEVLFGTPVPASGRPTLLAKIDAAGRLGFWELPDGSQATVALPGLDADGEQIRAALASATPVLLRPEAELRTKRRAAFMHDVVVVSADFVDGVSPQFLSPLTPALSPSDGEREKQKRVGLTPSTFFGENLEQHPERWIAADGWQFGSNALHVTGGDVGLIDGEGYADYRFEFDLELPREGQGMAGWIVRAQDPGNCLLFQLQSADSPYVAPEYQTRPNTLRPHIRRDGEWTLTEPLPLPKQVRRGETHHIAVECRGPQVTVFLDGLKVSVHDDGGFRTGAVGFRASGIVEQGLFRNIALRAL
jgi:hypothetical protein